eukprot:2953219-Rhodomonas_salina.1
MGRMEREYPGTRVHGVPGTRTGILGNQGVLRSMQTIVPSGTREPYPGTRVKCFEINLQRSKPATTENSQAEIIGGCKKGVAT